MIRKRCKIHNRQARNFSTTTAAKVRQQASRLPQIQPPSPWLACTAIAWLTRWRKHFAADEGDVGNNEETRIHSSGRRQSRAAPLAKTSKKSWQISLNSASETMSRFRWMPQRGRFQPSRPISHISLTLRLTPAMKLLKVER